MIPTGHQLRNKLHPHDGNSNMNDVTPLVKLDLSVHRATLTATLWYLSELQKKNLITPSIAKPFPTDPMDEEKLILHKAYRQVQQIRLNCIKDKLLTLIEKKIPICFKTLSHERLKFKKKISHLLHKFSPQPVNAVVQKKKERNCCSTKNKNKKSRERYNARRYKDKLISYLNNPESRGAVNLSSVDISLDELLALELGYGFVLSPNNPVKEEETLILEGFRFLDRLGKADAKLAEQRKKKNGLCDISQEDEISYFAVDERTSPDMPFARNASVPMKLRFSQPTEHQLQCNESKCIKSEFDDLNNKLINSVKSKQVKRNFNVSKRTRNALKRLKSLVREKVVDIRKVDKGQLIVIIDYSQRKLIEEQNINKIASLCTIQKSNWEDNRDFVENKFILLHRLGFITNDELTAVTGLLVGGKFGKLKNSDGSLKFTKVLSNKELFAKQVTPYVYPLLKAHKLPHNTLLTVQPDDVHLKIPTRLVVGMQMCQLSRVQIWLENLLKPLSLKYGAFEYLKDSSDYLFHIETLKGRAAEEEWNWNNHVLFNVDVKALYPSVKFEFLKKALCHAFNTYTDWSDDSKDVLIELIMYTLENQQVLWNGKFYMLCQGIATGAKHAVPLANIFLSYIVKDMLNDNVDMKLLFDSKLVMWRRYIDDGTGIFKGTIEEFVCFYRLLQVHFKKYDLEITCDTDTHTITDNLISEKEDHFITFLDVELYKVDGTIHSREHRKETSSSRYLSIKSAHPRHTFPGIVKSQLIRIRRICSLEDDYKQSVKNLEKRCLNSGYSSEMVKGVLSLAPSLCRSLIDNNTIDKSAEMDNLLCVRLIVLAGTVYEEEFTNFAKRLNVHLKPCGMKIVVVKSTSPSISRILFNNNDNSRESKLCIRNKCLLCKHELKSNLDHICSSTTGIKYPVSQGLSCTDGGIYAVTGTCNSQYTGKSIDFSKRCIEHFSTQKSSSVYQHKTQCHKCYLTQDFQVTLIESYHDRGKYSLSEREYLWNSRIKGTINIQKTLKSN